MIKKLFIGIGLGVSAFCLAGTYNVSLPPGTYKVWLVSAPPLSTVPATAIETDKPTVQIKGEGADIAVLNEANNNVALVPAKTQSKISASDFNRVEEVDISIQQGSAPIGSASVTLMAKTQQIALLDRSMKGIAKFYGVKIGPISVKIVYNEDGASQTMTQTLAAIGSHTGSAQIIQTAVPGNSTSGVPAVASTSGAASPPNSPATTSGSTAQGTKAPKHATVQEAFGKLMQMIIGVAIVAGLIYGGYWLIKKDPKAISEKLRALGAPIPADFNSQNDPNTNFASVTSPPPVTPVAQPQIVLQDAAPTPVSSASGATPISSPSYASSSPTPAASTEFGEKPRLVRDNGEDWVIQEGTSLIGREPGLAVSLVDESTLSRKHGEFTRSGAQISYVDLGSTNGSFCNGQKVDSSVSLKPGDVLQLGKVVFKMEAV